MPRKNKPSLEESATNLRDAYGRIVTFAQIVEFEKANGYVIGVPLPRYMNKVSRGVWEITDESIARYTNGLPPPKVVPSKAPKAPKVAKAPKVTTKAPKKPEPKTGGFSKMYDQLVDLRKDFEAQGIETIDNKSYIFTNKFGSFNMVNGILYILRDPENDPTKFIMVHRKDHGKVLTELVGA